MLLKLYYLFFIATLQFARRWHNLRIHIPKRFSWVSVVYNCVVI